MGTFRCTSRSIVLKIALRSLSRCTLAAGQKQKSQKVESTALYYQQNSDGVYFPLFMGVLFALHQKPNKTKSRTNADISADRRKYPPAKRQVQLHGVLNHALFMTIFKLKFNRCLILILSGSNSIKTIQQTAQNNKLHFV